MSKGAFSITFALASALVLALLIGHTAVAANTFTVDISSATHPDENAWYQNNSPSFSWAPSAFTPTLKGSYDTPGNSWAVATSGSYAYVADEAAGLQIINISDPSAPTLAGSYDTPGLALGVAVSGNYAYVADYGSGLQIINISDPAAPTLVGSYDTPGNAQGVAVSGSYAYVADGPGGLRIIDVSNPAAPTLAGSYATAGLARGLAVSGSYAYVANYEAGLAIINISNPASPTLVGSCTTDWAFGVAVSGSHAYVADYTGGFKVVDISDPTAPVLQGSYATPDNTIGVTASGNFAFVADDTGGLLIIDASDPDAPALEGSYDTAGYARGVALLGSYAYVADGTSGLEAVDVSDPLAPGLAGSAYTSGSPQGVSVSGNYAYVADGGSGLKVIGVSDPSAPTVEGSYATTGYAYGMAVSGSYAYVADDASGLEIIDVSNPVSPTLAGSYDTPGLARSVGISGNYAYVADGMSGLEIIDVSNPATPTLAGSYATPDNARGVAVSGSYAYVADGPSGLLVIDVSNPAVPTLEGSYATPDYAWGVAVSGSYAYVADYASGVLIINVSNPAAPTLAGSYDTPGYAAGVAISGSQAYVADSISGFEVLDISNPAAPTLEGSLSTPGNNFTGVAASGSYAFVSDYSTGLKIIAPMPAYSYVLDQSPSTIPDDVAEGLEQSHSYSGLADGVWYLHVRALGTDGSWGGTSTYKAQIDNASPIVSNVLPGGAIATTSTTISADYSDVSSGINTSTASLTVSGGSVGTCTTSATSISCPVTGLTLGSHTISGSVADNAGNSAVISGSFSVSKLSYYWTWYDNASPGAQNWVLMANPKDAGSEALFDLFIAGTQKNLTPLDGLAAGHVPAGRVDFEQYPATIGGPVKVDSFSGAAITSQRSLWAGNSLEEIPGMDETRLSDHYYWSWYDQNRDTIVITPPGPNGEGGSAESYGPDNWILIANPAEPGGDTVTAEISFRDVHDGHLVTGSWNIAPGDKVTPQFNGMMGGPLELKAFVQGGSWDTPADRRDVIASQRVLSGGGTSFNEVPGTPADELSNRYLWTWYDNKSPGAQDWVLVANPNATDVNVTIRIAGSAVVNSQVLHAGEIMTPTFDAIGGPVEVTATGNVIASQRVLWGPSFEEKPGIPASTTGGFNALDASYNWTWYDEASPGSANWVLISNLNTSSVYFELTEGSDVLASGPIVGGSSWTGDFPRSIGGPVQVKVWTDSNKTTPVTDKVIASQRVLWNGYFNEVEGTTLK